MADTAPRRVVSLVPSSTETLLALGADVVACTRFCEQPALGHVGGTKNPDIDAIVGLSPDVVVMDEEENRREDADALTAAGLTLFVTDVRDVADVPDVVRRLAGAAGVPSPPIEALAEVIAPRARWATAVVPIWRRPWMLLGGDTYGASLLGALGVEVWSPRGGRYDEVDLDELARARDVSGRVFVLAPTEPYVFRDTHLAELGSALPSATVLVVDGQDLFWWGTRTQGAIGRLSRQLAAA